MAAPFGRLPTLGQYMRWLEECGGRCETGIMLEDEISVSFMKLTTVEGDTVVVTDIEQSEYLVPTMIAYLDRRLQVRSSWHVDR